ncbi:NAD(P)-binding protein [Pleomassaria siparia CBS 279.74]|uniref:NAD(P)-binding protein n=1 Tax=Pleomassaria siparia CBS 279.74 TaxID=1314801 RepID=A0A6G1KH69_9PLEO|nr:NAD(P)-binding protein [Pleomassaria siparia CBS 279.74]
MSAQLGKHASSHAGVLQNFRRQLFQSVPPIPPAISLVGKTVLVTGSNVGLGLECARHFLKLRASRLIMGVRSVQKGEAAKASLRDEFPGVRIDVWLLDMESFASVKAFAAKCEKEIDRLHVAILNAGLAKDKFERVKEGREHEVTIQVNYLSTALLATLLIPNMKPTSSSPGPGRLSIVSSNASLGVKLVDPGETGLLDSLDRPDKFGGFPQYCISKNLITAFGARLAENVDPNEVIVNTVNPGATHGTAFIRDVSWIVKAVMGLVFGILGRTAVDASRIYVHACLVLGKESHGSYTDWLIRPWPVMIYKDRSIYDKLWNETMKEFLDVGVNVDGLLNEAKQ